MNDRLHWLTQTLQDVPDGDDWLSTGERLVLEGLRFPKRRNDFLLGRWTAKRAICLYRHPLTTVLAALEIRAAGDGAPEAFLDGIRAPLSVSISHSGGRSLCVVAPSGWALGCDVEQLEPREESLILDYFTQDEVAFCRRLSAEEQILAANLIWSAKESVLKALREGLRRDTRSVTVRADLTGCEEEWSPWTGKCGETGRVFFGWWRTCAGFIFTLTSDRPTSVAEEMVPLRSTENM